MYGFEHNEVDPHNEVPRRYLKVYLRTSLPLLQAKFQQRIEEIFDVEKAKSKVVSEG